MKIPPFICCTFLCLATTLFAGQPEIIDCIDVEPVWSGHRVGFCALTHNGKQYLAYYDADRQMTVASRNTEDRQWTFKKLPSHVKWDSHNYITMTFDRFGHIHLSGNMHNVPLIYFRTEKPGDITTLKQIRSMTGEDEDKVTYPRFFENSDGQLLFMYRRGGSGNGKRLINVYDDETETWKRLLATPLLDGTGQSMNAYPKSIHRCDNGWFHLVWMWRETPDCTSNRDISYARSRDLKEWESAGGEPLNLPITPKSKNVVVDPVPPGGGLLNAAYGYGFDNKDRVIISYIKFDKNGATQAYLARWEKNAWKIRQITDWTYRWEFGGGGSIIVEISVGGVTTDDEGRLLLSYRNAKHGSGVWVIDQETLEITGKTKPEQKYPSKLRRARSDFPGMGAKLIDAGINKSTGTHYVLRWETLGSNRDKPRPEPWPEPVMLQVYELKDHD